MSGTTITDEDNDYENLDEHKINYFPNGFFNEFSTGMSILKYKLAIYWMPILLFTIIMFIIVNTIFSSALFDDNITKTEIVGTVIAAVVIFVCYFLVDFIYQMLLCKKQKLDVDALNSVINAAHITIIVTLGYIFGIFLSDNNSANAELAQQELEQQLYQSENRVTPVTGNFMGSNIGFNNKSRSDVLDTRKDIQIAQQGLFKIILSSSQHNNIFMAVLFYFIGMAYWNPYYDENCSRNRMCK